MGVKRIKLGSQGLEVSAQGLGCMGMSAFYGPPKPDADMIALIHHAVSSGVTHLDTSDVYGPHTNELLLGKALQGGMREILRMANHVYSKKNGAKRKRNVKVAIFGTRGNNRQIFIEVWNQSDSFYYYLNYTFS